MKRATAVTHYEPKPAMTLGSMRFAVVWKSETGLLHALAFFREYKRAGEYARWLTEQREGPAFYVLGIKATYTIHDMDRSATGWENRQEINSRPFHRAEVQASL